MESLSPLQNLVDTSVEKRIALSWGENVAIRLNDLENGTDNSYLKIILPWVLNNTLTFSKPSDWILDVGCGCGFLTNSVYQAGRHQIQGIDFAKNCISCAQQHYPHISFFEESIYSCKRDKQYALCLAVMCLNNAPDLSGFLTSIKRLLLPRGKFLVVIPNPCFWPQRHITSSDYYYFNERAYEYTFSTKGNRDYRTSVLYFHRTRETYDNCIRTCGFRIYNVQSLCELDKMQNPDILAMILEPEQRDGG